MRPIASMLRRTLPVLPLALAACLDSKARDELASTQSNSCMSCHNGSQHPDYSGPGLENPHPFAGADNLACTTCHGGDSTAQSKEKAHVPPPPEIGDRDQQIRDARAWFNRLTLSGMDKFPDYSGNGRMWTAIDYLQFVNPGDLRVVSRARACGTCHGPHADLVSRNILATETGFFSGSSYFMGTENAVAAHRGLYDDTAADYGWRAVTDPTWVYDPDDVGRVGELLEVPVWSRFGRSGPMEIFRNPQFDAANLTNELEADGRVKNGSRMAALFMEQVSFTCGDCHLGSAGANNRYGDFRSSGCTACHMPYSADGRSRSRDPNVSKIEPLDPDDIDEPERSHVRSHRIHSVARTLPNGERIEGIDDATCAGCHQGSNRTVMQYWGIRLDQNADVRNHQQYPANPVSFRTTANDPRLFDPVVDNRTFNGRNPNQYLLHEDYDGDDRDDTPEDIHYEKGMGCIDCHAGWDLHGGDPADADTTQIRSRMEQHTGIECENCHGNASTYAATAPHVKKDGTVVDAAMDRNGRPLEHVVRDPDGTVWLTSKLDGRRHYVPQTRDAVVDSGKTHPVSGAPLWSALASYAMGRADADPANGIGPIQTNRPSAGFSHGDNMSCAACHSSWANSCVGCHLKGEYNEGNNFSNITGERIVYRQRNADFTYQSVVPFQIGVDAKNRISQVSTNTKVFYQWRDRQGQFTDVVAFTDRSGKGNNPAQPFGSLGHNALLQHSIRGKVSSTQEGPRYCVACHLTENSVANWRPEYDAFRAALAARNYGALDFDLLQTQIGRNPGNQLDSPFFVHMVAGLGSGLFLFNKDGGPVNPLDGNANRFGSNGVAPASSFDPAQATLDLDRIVDANGVSFASNNHSMLKPGIGPNNRDGATDSHRPGPLGATLIQKLVDPDLGVVLDSWIDADGNLQGDASDHMDGD